MNEKQLRFTCDKCKYSWDGRDYEDVEYSDGHECPECDSTHISSEDMA